MKRTIAALLVLCLMLTGLTAAAAAAGDEVYTVDVPAAGLHYVAPESLRNLKGTLDWSAQYLNEGLLNISVAYYAVAEKDMEAYVNFCNAYIDAFTSDAELPEAPDPSWMSGYESSYVYDIFTINGGRGEKELREALSSYGITDDMIESVTELGADGDSRFFLLRYAAAEAGLERSRAVMGGFYEEYESLVKKPEIFLSGLTLTAPAWPETRKAGDQISFKTTDLAGNPVESEKLFSESKVTMINCWATWCSPCKRELPELGEMAKAYESEGVRIIGLCMDADSDEVAADAEELLRDTGAEYLNLRCTEEIETLFRLRAYPTTFFVDSEGKILAPQIEGAYPDRYRETLTACLAGLG